MSDFKTVASYELRQWLANAFVTGSQALGHGRKRDTDERLSREKRCDQYKKGLTGGSFRSY
jgi:hypothetical protein